MINSRTVLIILIALFGLPLADLYAQLPVPVDGHMPTPLNLDFHGQWTCTDGTSIARIRVQQQHRRDSSFGLSRRWTELRESQDGTTLRLFTGYDPDTNKILMVDADDPAVISFATEGWHGTHLMLESIDKNNQHFPPYHILYDLKNSHQFTITWEILDEGKWKRDPSFTCSRSGHNAE